MLLSTRVVSRAPIVENWGRKNSVRKKETSEPAYRPLPAAVDALTGVSEYVASAGGAAPGHGVWLATW